MSSLDAARVNRTTTTNNAHAQSFPLACENDVNFTRVSDGWARALFLFFPTAIFTETPVLRHTKRTLHQKKVYSGVLSL